MVVDVPIVVEIRYEIGRIIGDGNFAVVREGVDRWEKKWRELVVQYVFTLWADFYHVGGAELDLR